jgi:hypothetical protein
VPILYLKIAILQQISQLLVSLVVEDWTWGELPREEADIWNALIYPIFLGATIRTEQAN